MRSFDVPKTKLNSQREFILKKLLCYFGGHVNIKEYQVRPSNYHMFFFFLRNLFLLADFLGFRDRMVYQECLEFLAPQGRKDHKGKMELRESLVSRDQEV